MEIQIEYARRMNKRVRASLASVVPTTTLASIAYSVHFIAEGIEQMLNDISCEWSDEGYMKSDDPSGLWLGKHDVLYWIPSLTGWNTVARASTFSDGLQLVSRPIPWLTVEHVRIGKSAECEYVLATQWAYFWILEEDIDESLHRGWFEFYEAEVRV